MTITNKTVDRLERSSFEFVAMSDALHEAGFKQEAMVVSTAANLIAIAAQTVAKRLNGGQQISSN